MKIGSSARVNRLKPANGFAHYVHIVLSAALPLVAYALVRMGFSGLALAVVLLSKWRMLAVRPRYWLTNIRANTIDILVGISTVVFMASSSGVWQPFWAAVFAVWLLFIKPRTGVIMVSVQALVGQLFGMTALFLGWVKAPLVALVIAVGFIAYAAARHFFTSFDEAHGPLYAMIWAYFAAALMWVLGHWLLFYGDFAQITLVLGVLGFGLAALYYLSETDRLTPAIRRQFVFIMSATLVVVLVFSDWGDKSI